MVNVYKNFIKKQALRAGESFDIELETSKFLARYRTTPNTATPGNVTPAMAHLNRELRTILDLYRPEVAAHFNENVRQNEAFDRHHGAKPKSFNINDPVFYRLNKDSTWKPAVVTERIGSRLYRLSENESQKKIRVHANQMKLRQACAPTTDSLRFLRSPDDYDYDVIEEDPSSSTPSSAASSDTDPSAESSPEPSPVAHRYPRRNRNQTQRLNVNSHARNSYV
uniref:Uncharacterized protein n=1 Tax=Panagrolaimus sp. ES5 TaxID=591445 RepID=A0AC34FDC2_9BILA